VGPAGLKEKDVTLSIANRMAKTLRDTYQVKATLTRAEDINLSPEKRASAANYNRGDVLVSIHTGTSAVSTAAGFQVFYASPAALVTRGKQAAKTSGAIAQAVAAELARSTSAASRGVREAPCRLFQGLAMPGILVELGPIGTASQEALLADDSHQQMIAQAIVTGLMNAVGAPKDSP
jgi:N-acetylmuramoyl-L-alanine amidase